MSNGTRYNADEWQVTHRDRDVRCVVNVTTGEERMIDDEGYFVKGPGQLVVAAESIVDGFIQIPTYVTRRPPQRI